MSFQLRYATRSDIGLVRSSNQDSAYAGPNLCIVADGMGGHAGGDVASAIAVESLRAMDSPEHSADSAVKVLEDAVESARLALVHATALAPQLHGMGTTVTALLAVPPATSDGIDAGEGGDGRPGTLVMAHMGDSRAYLLRDGRLTQQTVDHTFVQHLVDTGRITPQEADHHPQRNVVMRVLGDFDVDLTADMSVREPRLGDRWLLCSDGLSGFVSVDDLCRIVAGVSDVDQCAQALIDAAKAGQSTDNISVVVVDIVPDGDPSASRDVQVVGAAATGGPLPQLVTQVTSGLGVPAAPMSPQDHAVTDTGPTPVVVPGQFGFADGDGQVAVDGVESLLDGAFVDDDDDDDVMLEDADARKRFPIITTLAVLLVLAGIGFVGWRGYQWTQDQYFVGVADGQVAVFRGIPQNIGPFQLSHPVELTGTEVDSLPTLFATRIDDTIRADSLPQARSLAYALIQEAEDKQTSDEPDASPTPDADLDGTDLDPYSPDGADDNAYGDHNGTGGGDQ